MAPGTYRASMVTSLQSNPVVILSKLHFCGSMKIISRNIQSLLCHAKAMSFFWNTLLLWSPGWSQTSASQGLRLQVCTATRHKNMPSYRGMSRGHRGDFKSFKRQGQALQNKPWNSFSSLSVHKEEKLQAPVCTVTMCIAGLQHAP